MRNVTRRRQQEITDKSSYSKPVLRWLVLDFKDVLSLCYNGNSQQELYTQSGSNWVQWWQLPLQKWLIRLKRECSQRVVKEFGSYRLRVHWQFFRFTSMAEMFNPISLFWIKLMFWGAYCGSVKALCRCHFNLYINNTKDNKIHFLIWSDPFFGIVLYMTWLIRKSFDKTKNKNRKKNL